MIKKGCLNCHFLCLLGQDRDGRPCVNSAGPKLRNREGLIEQLEEMARVPEFPLTIRCFCDNWDATEIGKENTDEIIEAVFRKDRNKCLRFAAYDKYAGPDAIIRLEKQKIEVIDRRMTRIMAVIALVISFAALVISFLANLRGIMALFIG
jgi:hypothetical protein